MVWYQMFVVCKNGTIFSSYRYAAYFATIPQISAIIQLWIWCLFPSILFRVCYVLFIFRTVVAIYLLIHHRHQQTFRNIESVHQQGNLLLEFDSTVGPTDIVLQASYTKKDVVLTVSNITQFKHLVLYWNVWKKIVRIGYCIIRKKTPKKNF